LPPLALRLDPVLDPVAIRRTDGSDVPAAVARINATSTPGSIGGPGHSRTPLALDIESRTKRPTSCSDSTRLLLVPSTSMHSARRRRARMLSLPRELSVLCQTKLTLVVAVAAGHDPIKATVLSSRTSRTSANGLVRTPLRCGGSRQARNRLRPVAIPRACRQAQGETAQQAFARERLDADELTRSPLL
jgi:hypothetical protein